MGVGTERNGGESPRSAAGEGPRTVTHDAGDTAVLYCSITDLGDLTVVRDYWFVASPTSKPRSRSADSEPPKGMWRNRSPVKENFDGSKVSANLESGSTSAQPVTWRKLPKSSPLTIGERTWVKDTRIHAEHVPNSTQWNLVIQNVNATDAGTYECQVSKRGKPIRHKVHLAVKGIEISGRNFLKQGENIHLQCNATMVDVSMDNLEWLKDGSPLQQQQQRMRVFTSVSLSPSMSGTISSTLEIRDAQVPQILKE
ncbi:hypothetical protein BaRGS_00032632, partial [Batillaria attramentaria]